jgi:heme/copper-type cytochrome/quinol oxidase subunit 4
MSDLCSPTFADLAARLGFSCETAGGLVELRNPFALENWTLPVLELTVVVGAVLALVYAIRRLRRHNDPTNIVLWFGAIAYLLIIEPPLYFPAAFGIAEHVDTMFAHNVFTVEFLWGRLPLYIVAIYPMMATVAFEIVRRLGVFRRYGTVVGAVCVGFVHHAFYEIFDHLGPQLRWWEWTLDHPMAQPFFDSVPLPSVVVFATLWPMSLALCVQFFIGRHVEAGRQFTGGQVVLRTVVIGLLASIGTAILPLPATVAGAVSGSTTVGGIVYAAELVAISLVAIPVLYLQWRRRTEIAATPGDSSLLIFGYAVAYLVVLAALWVAALPAYLGAVDGLTEAGDPIGSLWYTVVCFVIAGLSLAAAWSAERVQDRTAVNQSVSVPANSAGS